VKEVHQIKNICFVVTSPFSVNAFLINHFKALSENHRVTLCTNLDLYPLNPDLSDGKVHIIHVPLARRASPLKDWSALWILFHIFRRNHFDAVHSLTSKAGLLSMTAAFLSGAPFRFHTFTGQLWETAVGLKRYFYKKIDWLIARLSTQVFADSASQIQFLVSEKISPQGTIAILGAGSISGVDLDRFKPNISLRNLVRDQYGAKESTCVFLFLSRLIKSKGVIDLIKAYAILAKDQDQIDSALWIVGPDEENIRAQVANLPNIPWSNIHWIGATFEPERYMAGADVFMLPSYREGFGSVIIEAAACALPTLAYKVNGVVDAVDHPHTGLLSAVGEISELYVNMKKLAIDSDFRIQLGHQALQRVHQQFSSKVITQAWIDFYNQQQTAFHLRFCYSLSKRLLDLALALVAALLLVLPMLTLAFAVKATSSGPILYWSQRVGKNNTLFFMPKFRSMKVDTPAMATHLLTNPQAQLTLIGKFLRNTSLDELPQLWCIFQGKMSFVGPRPALFNQDDLIALRNKFGVQFLLPGLTGWAQVNGRDEISIPEKVKLDVQYLQNRSLLLDLKILWITFIKVLNRENVSH
jgi:lipopolysaccharide/colanic/teichoic acid biosynthesis glycosyltransferase